ncbi:CPBP family intramembrane glutamic endopeptidase [Paenibacillus dokdonensis]|uniref:CPBP family intramembrane glutamic endopeptidase n=1 Tax=Paenibacillus dokdonensis TaxID=2567944 RepID=UPI001457CF08|nr:type II CAAX endopeptidase family protein [Paenibacillus dokdonensis]
MNINSKSSNHNPWNFFMLVFILAIPFWLIGMAAEHWQQKIPINLPFSALMFVCPMIAAFILVFRTHGSDGIKKLLKKSFHLRMKYKIWFVPLFLLMPVITICTYGFMKLMGEPLPNLHFSILTALTFFVVFFIAAICEEIGWQGYVYDMLEKRSPALGASIVLGVTWQLWHVVPHVQNHHSPAWILWQCAGSVLLRILIVWFYKNMGKSVLAGAIFHAMNNVCSFLLPNYDSSYVTFSLFIMTALAAIIITFLWGSKTLTRYRFKHAS